jgi:hypothetical protein
MDMSDREPELQSQSEQCKSATCLRFKTIISAGISPRHRNRIGATMRGQPKPEGTAARGSAYG